MKMIGNVTSRERGRWLNDRAENPRQTLRRREGAMARFRDIKTLQEFAAVHASIRNHFNQDRHLNRRDIFKQNRSTALAEGRQPAARESDRFRSASSRPVNLTIPSPSHPALRYRQQVPETTGRIRQSGRIKKAIRSVA